MRRTAVLLLGCLAASLTAGLAGAAVIVCLMWVREGQFRGDVLSALLVFGFILTAYAAAASVTLGLSAHALLTRLGRTGRGAYLIAGLAAGVLVGLLFGGLRDPAIFATGLGAGAAGAMAFRAVVRPRSSHVASERPAA